MSAPDHGIRLMPSLLDRLTDLDTAGYGVAVGYSEAEMRNAVKNDLADLLNAKMMDTAAANNCPVPQTGAGPKQPLCYGTGRRAGPVCGTCCPELKDSLLAYGLPDLSTYDATDRSVCEQLARVIERIIARHEPRLHNVRVTVPRQAFNTATRELQFTVEAALSADGASYTEFATVLELISGQARVGPATGRRAT